MFDFMYPMYFKIPSRFDNQNFFPLNLLYVSNFDSIASVTVDIPDDCLSSDWWSVAVFVALEAEVPQDSEEAAIGFQFRYMHLCWNFDTLGPEDGSSLSLSAGSTSYNNLYLITMVVSGDFIYIRRHQRGLWKSMHEPFSKHRKPEFNENSSLRFEVKVKGCKIRKCWWRMLSKEDYMEDLQMMNRSGLVAPSDSGHSAGMDKSSLDESNGKDTTALDASNIERSNENFSLVSHLLIIA